MHDQDLLRVLHAVRLAGINGADAVVERSEVGASRVASVLTEAQASGWVEQRVVVRDRRPSGWMLTAQGRRHGEALLAAEVALAGAAEALVAAYERFRTVNQQFLDVCTDWQLFPDEDGRRAVNDHSDPDYDRAVVERLVRLDEVIQPVLADLASALARFEGYGERFAAARRLVEAGERDWFTRPLIDSYHTIWFELHEDLLATLGLERSHEHRS
ncbi:MAG TPA: hypothetical protein PKY13_12220 [Microthrixaceae bacterium]|mgnify:FL=1|jgi:hypothetical protein|nr:hypothetical protein [Microthrixaceae bacterium]HQF95794.1 hypothetical protein [Microthrixaceae bacterium]